jgi:hypothetical protein
MVYPTLKSIRDKELKECSIKFGYSCNELECDFDSCLRDAKQSADLKSSGLFDISAIVIDALKNNQELFTVKEAGGFIFQAAGRGQVVLVNETPRLPAAVEEDDKRRYGIIDVAAARRRYIQKHELNDFRIGSPDLLGLFGSMFVGGSISFVFFKLLRKL